LSGDYKKDDDYWTIACRELYSFENIALAAINLWELDNAMQYIQKIFDANTDPNNPHFTFLDLDAQFIMGFIKSIIGSREEACHLAFSAYEKLINGIKNSWSRGYGWFFVGKTFKELGNLDRAIQAYKESIDFAEKTHYKVVKAKSLTGLAEIYREKEYFDEAFLCHQSSIEILKVLNARPDLAEAYFQLGLSYQVVGEMEKRQEYRDKAVQLFTEMEAPRQVERVKQAFADVV
ncbi:MAG TPA: hypothetical protein DCP31_05420, partial [Cyanobacteria bacterium UBA8543]|nr:hypothetical protein [Cyanobacteria bacterium UBA8543]